MKITSLIITYNSPISKSATLQSILDAELDNIELTICIWNNGPKKLDDDDILKYLDSCKNKNITVYVFQDLRNISLAIIYNKIIKKFDFDFIAILDQDSTLKSNYFQNVLTHKEFEFILPQIFILKDNKLVQTHPHLATDSNILIDEGPRSSNITSVTSGLVMAKTLIDKITQYRGYVFEERLGFYGIDVEIFRTINAMIKDNIFINSYCVGSIQHSFASNDPNEFNSPFRYLELSYFKYFARKNFQKKLKITTLWICLRDLIRGKLKLQGALSLIRFINTNTHPRSRIILEDEISYTHSNCHVTKHRHENKNITDNL